MANILKAEKDEYIFWQKRGPDPLDSPSGSVHADHLSLALLQNDQVTLVEAKGGSSI